LDTHFLQLTYSFSFTASSTTELYTLSLHDALPISPGLSQDLRRQRRATDPGLLSGSRAWPRGVGWPLVHLLPRPLMTLRPSLLADRKSTRLNSSHVKISYAVFCLKKKTC